MREREGIIKFQLEYRRGKPLAGERLREINAWRRILYLLRLTGQDPGRYDGLGYGNISQRLEPFEAPPHQRRFVISGTQTGGIDALDGRHYALVLECDPERNRVVAEGPIRPSSEALTHGALYGCDESLRFVMHVHSPEIWRHAETLKIPLTGADVPYGTPEMAGEVRRLMSDATVRCGHILAMGGHEDGIVAFGETAGEAGTVLLGALARALQVEERR